MRTLQHIFKSLKSTLVGTFTVFFVFGSLHVFAADPNRNIVDNLNSDNNFSNLVSAVSVSGLGPTLTQPGPYTLFAPTNAAFAKLPAGLVDNLLKPENRSTLDRILRYHVVTGEFDASQLTSRTSINSVEGGSIAIVSSNNSLTLNNSSQVTQSNIDTNNGLIHAIDTLIVPPGLNISALVPTSSLTRTGGFADGLLSPVTLLGFFGILGIGAVGISFRRNTNLE